VAEGIGVWVGAERFDEIEVFSGRLFERDGVGLGGRDLSDVWGGEAKPSLSE